MYHVGYDVLYNNLNLRGGGNLRLGNTHQVSNHQAAVILAIAAFTFVFLAFRR